MNILELATKFNRKESDKGLGARVDKLALVLCPASWRQVNEHLLIANIVENLRSKFTIYLGTEPFLAWEHENAGSFGHGIGLAHGNSSFESPAGHQWPVYGPANLN